jgi:hypothetical protein
MDGRLLVGRVPPKAKSVFKPKEKVGNKGE